MRLVSRRRFPETITRIRYGAGSREGLSGKWVDGTPVETELRASVQPIELIDDESPGVDRLRERLKVYVPEADALRAAPDNTSPDQVVFLNRQYEVERSESWGVLYTQAVLIRES